ncbi:MAG: AfsR/SARP family transcriptional regulator [Acidimicrobiia bacterium]|nr:AfsR/SARP family transcriptional regulator [Acidimicrobiia bacterium]
MTETEADTTEQTAVGVEAISPNIELTVLGPITAYSAGNAVSLGGPKQLTVLAILIAANGREVSSDVLVDALYRDAGNPRARRIVHTYVSNLRRELGDAIHSTGRGYRMSLPRRSIDACVFEDVHRRARVADDDAEARKLFGQALDLWTGDAYTGLEDVELLAPEIARLTELHLTVTEARIDLDLGAGLHRQLVAELDGLVIRHRFRDSFRAQQMLALYRSGRQREALQAYNRYRTDLAGVGLEPSRYLQALEHQVLTQDPALDL